MFRQLSLAVIAAVSFAVAAPAFANPATDFSLRDVNGQQVTLSDYKGQVVLISFWATWCGPCKVEMKHLHEFYQEYHDDGLVVLWVATDDPRTMNQVKPYVKRNKYTESQFLLDNQSKVVGIYNKQKTLPYGVLIGRDFEVAKQYSGYNPGDEAHVLEDIKAELAKPAPTN